MQGCRKNMTSWKRQDCIKFVFVDGMATDYICFNIVYNSMFFMTLVTYCARLNTMVDVASYKTNLLLLLSSSSSSWSWSSSSLSSPSWLSSWSSSLLLLILCIYYHYHHHNNYIILIIIIIIFTIIIIIIIVYYYHLNYYYFIIITLRPFTCNSTAYIRLYNCGRIYHFFSNHLPALCYHIPSREQPLLHLLRWHSSISACLATFLPFVHRDFQVWRLICI